MRPDDPMPEAELAMLTTDLEAVRPQADSAFLAALEQRVRDGFPTPASPAPPRRRAWRPTLRWLPAGGALVAAAAVGAIVLASGGDQRDSGDLASVSRTPTAAAEQATGAATSSSSGSGAAADSAAPSETTPAARSAAPVPAPSSSAAGSTAPAPESSAADRKVERSADLTLTPPRAKVQETADGVVRQTQAVGGYVQRSEVHTTDTGGIASFTLRIPSAKLDDALAGFAKLAHVGSLSQGSTDITAPTASAADRLSDARAERQALLKALGRATTDRQIASLRARLADNRSEIATRKGELDALRRRADLSTVLVTVQGSSRPEPQASGGWTPGDALHDAGRVLEVAGGIAVVALAVLAPLSVLALLGWLAARALGHRRREAALDRAA